MGMDKVCLCLVIWISLAAALSSPFTVVSDVCPVSLEGWKQYKGKIDELSACEAACSSVQCSIFTFNHHTSPKQCWGYQGSSPQWHVNANSHCESGCLKSLVKDCGAGPAPPPGPGPLPPGFPRWVGTRPSVKMNASAGLPMVQNAQHITVYNATGSDGKPNPFGAYGHGPMITKLAGVYYMSWYNAPVGERDNKRSVYAHSVDAVHWSAPAVLFSTFTQTDHGQNVAGEENGPWTILNGRMYTQSGTQDAGEHHENIISVMRQVGKIHPRNYYYATPPLDEVPVIMISDSGAGVEGDPTKLGQPFWLNRTIPSYCNASGLNASYCEWPTYLQMDPATRADAEQLIASLVRTTVAWPDLSDAPPAYHMQYNERSLYKVPGTRQLALLLRGVRGGLSVSMCSLPEPVGGSAPDHTLFSCRSGVGDAFMNLVELVSEYSNASDPRTCNWTAPRLSTLPDSGSRTCAATFPSAVSKLVAGVYMVSDLVVACS